MRFCVAILAAIVLLPAETPAENGAITPSEYHARRAAVAKALGPNSAFIASSREPARRTFDVDWPFRPTHSTRADRADSPTRPRGRC
jgi:hypothetical protein